MKKCTQKHLTLKKQFEHALYLKWKKIVIISVCYWVFLQVNLILVVLTGWWSMDWTYWVVVGVTHLKIVWNDSKSFMLFQV